MTTKLPSPAFILSLVGLALGAGVPAHGAAAAPQAYPAPGAVYSAGVVSPAGATLAVVGGVAGNGATVAAAAASALAQVEARLKAVGLGRQHLLRVRAALPPSTTESADIAAWNEAWSRFFGSGHRPAQTTAFVSALPDPAAKLVLDVVAAYPGEAGHPVRVDGARPALNPNLRLAGPAENPTALVSTRSGLLFTSGVVGERAGLSDPDSMEQQMRSALHRLQINLGDHGLRWEDAFFLRVLPTPQPARSAVDFAAWVPVNSALREATGGVGTAQTMWASPGFSTRGIFIEVEVWGVPPTPSSVFAKIDWATPNPLLRMSGAPNASIASVASIAPNAALLWVSGVVSPQRGAIADEAIAALAVLKDRLATMGTAMSDVAELRVFTVSTAAGFAQASGAWNRAYGTAFNNATVNLHKPVRTSYAVEALPDGRSILLEAVAVLPPKGFPAGAKQ